jgi:hypothetical protein
MHTTSQDEQQRITEYSRGWNDAALRRAPRSASLVYLRGYREAR